MAFAHLHLHTQYSILDGLTNIKKLFARARELNMPAVAITDHGNMYGVKEFMKWGYDKKTNIGPDGKPIVKPIIGCEIYVTRHYDHRLKDTEHRAYYHLILLAKNYEGYKNLMNIVSLGHIEGSYYGKPRVTHEIVEKYHENLICCSACLAGEIPKDILAGDLDAAREAIRWHKGVFGEDYYLEVMLHRTEVPGLDFEVYDSQKIVNAEIFRLAEEMDVKVVATNDVHFLMEEDGPVHDHLICLTTNVNLSETKRLHYTQQEFLKSEDEMRVLFPDHPEVIDQSVEIASKIEYYKIDRSPVLPKYDLPAEFMDRIDEYLEKYKSIIDEGRTDKDGNNRGEEFCRSVAYLCYLTYEGAHRRYGAQLSDAQVERIDFELKTICKMGFPDYFLIVQDYIAACRAMGYLVGPGRGSAAGSVVAYCLKITNLDPLKYDLLFERFLNPDRISMPDIDVDFESIPAAHKYVEDKYGADHVSRVITFGTMAAKSSIKDVARISQMSIDESNRLSKMVPDRLTEKQEREYPFNPKLDQLKPGFKVRERNVEVDDPEHPGSVKLEKKQFQAGLEEVDVPVSLANCYRLVPDFKNEMENGNDLSKEVLKFAQKLEGSIRQVGQHACATIIGRGRLTDYIPICLSRDKETGEEVWTSQYDGHYIEDVGMLKMDFLGLNTLSIIHKTLDYIKARSGKEIDIEAIPIDDPAVYELYGRGDTTVVFQFESEGMKNWLQKLRPTRFEDLIAMNALYRPGPMDYIPDFVDRKQGLKPIAYDLPEMEEYLADTYGITVYQEQVMLLSQKLAGFTKGQADTLRKAMGKKQIETLNSLKDKFMSGGIANGHPEKTLDKIWKDWEKFAQYAFNKSHATCYAWVSYQTGWLKTHYTAEFLAANLSCNLSDMEEIKKIMRDCKLHKIKLLNPDVNESEDQFTVNKKGNIRFGLGGIKGFGANIVDAILQERKSNGPFSDVCDLMERVPSINRRALESLVYAGALDSFGFKRGQYFSPCASGELFIDELVRYADLYRRDCEDTSASLFGDMEEMKPVRPQIPQLSIDEDPLEQLQKEKELVGMYLSSHPLDQYAFQIETFADCELVHLQELKDECEKNLTPRKVSVAGIVLEVNELTTRRGTPGLKVVLEDFSGPFEMAFFGNELATFGPLLQLHAQVFMELEISERKSFWKPESGAPQPPVSYMIKTLNVMPLENVNSELLDSFVVNVTTEMITPEFRKQLLKVVKSHKGRTPLLLHLSDAKTGYNVDFRSKDFMVDVGIDLISDILTLGATYGVKIRPRSKKGKS
ncbi:MAG: DNA polymerase III subunit alpha [Bacteroidales bacterium]|nr:DNA polymerase III subunit alpha [Bacteroidales bacterium]